MRSFFISASSVTGPSVPAEVVAAQLVADRATRPLVSHKLEAWLECRPIDDEAHAHQFPALAAVEGEHLDVAVPMFGATRL